MTRVVKNLAGGSHHVKQKGVNTDMPGIGGFDITLSDSVDETRNFRALYLGDAAAATIVVVTVMDDVVTFNNVQPGQILPVQGYRVNSTSTTATNIVGMY